MAIFTAPLMLKISQRRNKFINMLYIEYYAVGSSDGGAGGAFCLSEIRRNRFKKLLIVFENN